MSVRTVNTAPPIRAADAGMQPALFAESSVSRPERTAFARELQTANEAQAAHEPRHVAAQLVAQLFFVPMLEQMRRFPLGREFGFGGRGEEIFGQQLDLRMADAIAAADRGGLVDSIAQRLANRDRSGAGWPGRSQPQSDAGIHEEALQ